MSHEAWNELKPGTIIEDPGSASNHFTGHYRKGLKPEFNELNCIHCFFCWVFCPENAIMTEAEKISGINYDYCKGCGICANECPVENKPKPLIMIKEVI